MGAVRRVTAQWPRRSKIEPGGQKVKPKTQAGRADHPYTQTQEYVWIITLTGSILSGMTQVVIWSY